MVRFFHQISVAQITLNCLVLKPCMLFDPFSSLLLWLGSTGALGLGFAADTFRC